MVKSNISPHDIINVNNTLFFRDGGNNLWKSNGIDAAGTVLVKAGVFPDRMVNVNGALLFRGYSNANFYELWKSDGTDAGTVMVKDINPGTGEGNPNLLTNVNGTLYFTADEPATGTQLWKSDGTAAGTVLVQNISPGTSDSTPGSFSNVNGVLYFNANNDTNGAELWQSNGTLAGTFMIQDIAPGYLSGNPTQITNANGAIYFVANNNELWKRVGTSAALRVKGSLFPKQLTFVNGLNLLFFMGWDAVNGNKLWVSDGTVAGTAMVKDIRPGSTDAGINFLTSFNNLLYFVATSDTANAGQLWKSDGTSAGTIVVRSDIKNVKSLTVVNNKLFFVGDLYSGTTKVHDSSLWVIDGATAPAEVMAGIWPANLTAMGSLLFFQGQNSHGSELWKSDGTQLGTGMVKDINPTGSSNPEHLTAVNGTLYFTVWNNWDTPVSIDIWKSDGSNAGTVLVKKLYTDWAGYLSASLTSVHGLLAFVFDDQIHGAELWTSNGTDAGTAMVKEIYPGLYGSSPANLTMANTGSNVLNEALFFSAIDPIAGNELFILDFTPPTSSITSPLNGAYLRGASFVITGTAGDSMPGTGVNLVQVSTNNGASYSSAANTSGGIPWAGWQYTWNNPADGVYTIKSKSTDLATNVQSPDASITVTIDNTPPVVTFGMPAYSRFLTVQPVAFSEVEINPDVYCETTTNSYTGCSWSTTKPASAITFAGEGSHTVYAWSRDKAGNVSASKSATVIVDLTPPVVTAFTLPAYSKSLTVNFTTLAATDLNGIAGYMITESPTAPSSNATGWSATKPISFTFNTTGSKTIHAWAKDPAGNVSLSKSATIIVDLTPPVVTGFTIPTISNSLTVNVTTLTASDNFNVIGGYLITETTAVPLATATGWSAFKPSFYTFTSAGSKILYAWAKDAAGNVSSVRKSAPVIVDLTPPVVTFSMPAAYNVMTVPITFTATDSNGITGYCLTTTASSSGCNSWPATAPASYTFTSEGNNTLYAWAKDTAGNISALKNATTLVALAHTLTIDLSGTGSGTVKYGNQVFNADHQVTVYSYDQVTLQAMPSEYSQFSEWGGVCPGTGTGDYCVYKVPSVASGATQTATATFTYDSANAVYVAPSYHYATIGGAYSAATTVSGADIRIFGTSFSETLLFDQNKEVTLVGGDNQAHTSNSGGMTTVKGTLTVKYGVVALDEITLK
jgi:ELWxxDGT repeat protein